MQPKNLPYIIHFPKLGDSNTGFISVAESSGKIPFRIDRIFWTYQAPESVIRGHHAHYSTEQVLIAVSGRIRVETEMPDGTKETFLLDKPEDGLYIPPHCWHTMQYENAAVQLVLASTTFNEEDYIRSYEDFKKHYGS